MSLPVNVNQNWDTRSIGCYHTVEGIQKRFGKGNYRYLCAHPEIRAILRLFIHYALNERPKNLHKFAAKVFNCNAGPMLPVMLNGQLKRVNALLAKGYWSKYDGENFFKERPSTHSLLSQTSVTENIDSILNFALILNKSGHGIFPK